MQFPSFVSSLLVIMAVTGASAADPELPTYLDAEEAGPDFAAQGEYVGEVETDEGNIKFGVQVIALGDGKFKAVSHTGGLPGEGWSKGGERILVDGIRTAEGVRFKHEDSGALLKDGVIVAMDSGGDPVGRFERVERKSPTLGAEPPAGAIVLFDGTNADEFEDGRMTDDKLLAAGTTSRRQFGDFVLHIEFRTPFMPTATGQARGNSGVYLQDRYEIQVLDSFGLEGLDNECGGIYSVQEPKVNMCLPPLAWQTYDVEFTAPRFDAAGTKKANARATVKFNGVVIYEHFELPKLTPGGEAEEAPRGPLKLQDHGNPVHFRNIWIVEK